MLLCSVSTDVSNVPPAVWQRRAAAHGLKSHERAASPGAGALCARDEAAPAGEGWPPQPADGLVLGANQATKPGG